MKTTKQGGRPIPQKAYEQREMDKLAEELLKESMSDDLPDCLAGAPLPLQEQRIPLVLIDGVEYVPKAAALKPENPNVLSCLKTLTEMRYFDQQLKMKALAWNAIHALSPELAELDEESAYNMVHSETGHQESSDRPISSHELALILLNKPNTTVMVTGDTYAAETTELKECHISFGSKDNGDLTGGFSNAINWVILDGR